MEINVLNDKYEKIAVIDDYTSLICCKRYYDVGALDLQIEATKENIAILKEGYYITRKDDDVIYQIKAIELDTNADHDNSLIIGAVDCKSILSQRIIWNITNFNGSLCDYIIKLIRDNITNPDMTARKIDNFQIKDFRQFNDKISQQVSYENLQDKIIELCKTYNIGWKVTLEDGVFYFDLFKGVDRSASQSENPLVIFSPKLDNLEGSKYNFDCTEFKNVALIGGEGEGKDRKMASVGDSEGLERFEMFVDGGSSSSNTEDTLSSVQYLNQLSAKGYEELAKTSNEVTFEGEVSTNQLKYKEDFFLGDIVTIENEHGISTNARITEIVETWDKDGYTIEPVFEYGEFQMVYNPIELESELVSTYADDSDEEIVFYKDDFPYGLTIEVHGGMGQDGEDGYNGQEFLPIDEIVNTPLNYVFVPSQFIAKGGTCGDDVQIEFEVDGVPYTAKSVGGFGGGGGGNGGFSLKMYWEDPKSPIFGDGGKGGYGGKGSSIILNIIFNDFVKIKNINFKETYDEGKDADTVMYVDKSTTINMFSATAKGTKGGDSGDGNVSINTIDINGADGADAVTVRTGHSTDYPEHIVGTNSVENDHVVKVYKWVDKN